MIDKEALELLSIITLIFSKEVEAESQEKSLHHYVQHYSLTV
jgi:hypothetical protein